MVEGIVNTYGTDVTSGWGLQEAQHGETDDAEEGVDDDNGAADVVLVSDDSTGEHPDSGDDVRWCDEALGHSGVEAHAVCSDN